MTIEGVKNVLDLLKKFRIIQIGCTEMRRVSRLQGRIGRGGMSRVVQRKGHVSLQGEARLGCRVRESENFYPHIHSNFFGNFIRTGSDA